MTINPRQELGVFSYAPSTTMLSVGEIKLIGTLAALVVGKPAVCWVFILCFRYRVSTPRPMSKRIVTSAALLRSGIGIATILAVFLFAGFMGNGNGFDTSLLTFAYLFLFCVRVTAWHVLGRRFAKIQDRSLLAWTSFGIGIDFVGDAAIVALGLGSPVAFGLLSAAIVAFLIPLYLTGQRPNLKARFFSTAVCKHCGYDLGGLETKHKCPECGTHQHVPPPTAYPRSC